jgi:hypothetical protein
MKEHALDLLRSDILASGTHEPTFLMAVIIRCSWRANIFGIVETSTATAIVTLPGRTLFWKENRAYNMTASARCKTTWNSRLLRTVGLVYTIRRESPGISTGYDYIVVLYMR